MDQLKLLSVFVIITILHFSVSSGIIEEGELQLGVSGDAALSDTRNHNRKVVCIINFEQDWIMEETDALLCTHFIFSALKVNVISFQLSFHLFHSDPIPRLISMNKMRKGNPHIKLLLHLDILEKHTVIVKDQRKMNIFFASVYKSLRQNNFDGISLQVPQTELTEYSLNQQFTCGLHEYLRKGNMEIGFWLPGNVEQLSKWDIRSVNPCVDFFLIHFKKKDYQREFTHHAYPLHQPPENHSYPSFQRLVGTVLGFEVPGEKIVMTISPEGRSFTLLRNAENKTTQNCCGTGKQAKQNAKFPELEYVKKSDVLNRQLCKLLRNTTWQIFRSENPGKEVFMTDRKRWISFEDNVSLQAKVNFSADLNISFVIFTITQDNSKPQTCQKDRNKTGFSYAFLRNLNYLLHQRLQEKRKYSEENVKYVTPNFSVDDNLKACELAAELRKAGIAKSEHNFWLCVAFMETKFNLFYEHSSNPTTDVVGCSTTRYGIFGLYSPICSNARSIHGKNLCTPSICEDTCEDLSQGNISANIQCFFKAARSLEGPYPTSFPYCSDTTNAKFDFDFTKCDRKGRLGTMTSITPTYTNASFSPTQPTATTNLTVTIVSGVSLFAVISAVFFGFMFYRRKHDASKLTGLEINAFKNGTEGNKIVGSDGKGIADDVNSAPYDKRFEVALSDYRIYSNSVLGSGQFGTVYKALALNKNCAAKTLKAFTEKEYLLALLAEIKIMTYLGKHENIVEFVGSSTQLLSSNIVYLFVEFCELGSLEKYLRSNRNEYSDDSGPGNDSLCKLDLVYWSYQIANGMAHLALKGVIHGDLSAKNVLLTADRIAKVSDFGLSRKLYTYTSYIKQKQEPLPWRWMSIEALRELKFSTESDVWSFGVTLWEIFSLGNIPYPGQNYTFDFIDKLVDEGLRLPKPQLVEPFLFDNIITPTWNEIAEERPSFTTLKELLQNILREQFHDYTVLSEHCSNAEPFGRYSVLSYL